MQCTKGFLAFPVQPADDSINLPEHSSHLSLLDGSADRDPTDDSTCKFQNDYAFLKSNRPASQVLVPGILTDSSSYVVTVGYPGISDDVEAMTAAASDILAEYQTDPKSRDKERSSNSRDFSKNM